MGFQFDHEGFCVEGQYSWEDAIRARIEDLQYLVFDDSELELDYNPDDGNWYAMSYNEDRGFAFPIEDENNNAICAFATAGEDSRDIQTIVDILNEMGVYYVGY